MNKNLYPKLALENIKKNGKTYFPYIITCIITIAMFYIMKSLSLNEGISQSMGADSVYTTLSFGSYIVIIFSGVFLIYTNSFLMRQRKKEFGLYNILGMEKKHIIKVISLETIYVTLISFVGGLIFGIIFDKLMYLVIAKIMNIDVKLGFYVSLEAIITTLIGFAVIFVIIFIRAVFQIQISNPIELLNGGNVGEKEPKSKWFMAILGVICLGIGYYIAITIKNPVGAFMFFFIAVLFVIIGTYLLFTAGSIVFLKLLRKNKNYYYKTKNFISVSGMIYRMKQNAVGLSNICIISTMVLIMVSSTVSLWVGMKDIMNTRFPYDINITNRYYENYNVEDRDRLVDCVREELESQDISITNDISYSMLGVAGLLKNDTFTATSDINSIASVKEVYFTAFISISDYNAITGMNKTLSDDEIMIYDPKGEYRYDTFNVFDEEYNIVEKLSDFGNKDDEFTETISETIIVIVNDINKMDMLQKKVYGDTASSICSYYNFDIECDDEKKIEIYKELWNILSKDEYNMVYLESKAESKDDFVAVYGSFLFLGAFLGVLFIVAAILIIYYKQISEGYEDKNRFEIMQKVGMNHKEVRGSIRSQILTIFFLPLVTAGIHICFAFPLVSKILMLLNLANTSLYILCTAVCFVIFAIIYVTIYLLTAKSYYKIVSV